MKTLVFIRHAKSSWEGNKADLIRPLSAKGITDANLISQEFAKLSFVPDAIYCSPATRAQSTCKIFLKTLEISNDNITTEQQLYDFGGERVYRFLKTLDDSLQKVIVFGHNHAFTSLINSFGDIHIDNLPTCGLVMIDFDVNHWEAIKKGKTQLMLFPKDFR